MEKDGLISFETLGLDIQKKNWLITIYKNDPDIVDFYVFDESQINQDVRFKAAHELHASLSLFPPNEAIILDFVHERVQFEDNWQNRGIGTILLHRVEEWATQAGFVTIRGFLSPHDEIDKLKHFYSKNGWTIEIPITSEYTHHQGIYKGIGMVYKKLTM